MIRRIMRCFVLFLAIICTNNIVVAKEVYDMGIWNVKAYVDEFDLPTDEYYVVSNLISGTFSNTAVTQKELNAYIYYAVIDKERVVWFKLLPYGNIVENNVLSQRKNYNITIMGNDGEKKYLTGYMNPKSDQLYVDTKKKSGFSDSETLYGILRAGGTVRIAISENENPLVKYVLIIDDASGLDYARSQYVEKQFVTCGLYLGAKINHDDFGKGIVTSMEQYLQNDRWVVYISAEFSDGIHGFYEYAVAQGIVKLVE